MMPCQQPLPSGDLFKPADNANLNEVSVRRSFEGFVPSDTYDLSTTMNLLCNTVVRRSRTNRSNQYG